MTVVDWSLGAPFVGIFVVTLAAMWLLVARLPNRKIASRWMLVGVWALALLCFASFVAAAAIIVPDVNF